MGDGAVYLNYLKKVKSLKVPVNFDVLTGRLTRAHAPTYALNVSTVSFPPRISRKIGELNNRIWKFC